MHDSCELHNWLPSVCHYTKHSIMSRAKYTQLVKQQLPRDYDSHNHDTVQCVVVASSRCCHATWCCLFVVAQPLFPTAGDTRWTMRNRCSIRGALSQEALALEERKNIASVYKLETATAHDACQQVTRMMGNYQSVLQITRAPHQRGYEAMSGFGTCWRLLLESTPSWSTTSATASTTSSPARNARSSTGAGRYYDSSSSSWTPRAQKGAVVMSSSRLRERSGTRCMRRRHNT